ncbi:MAG: primosomal protein N' [Chloroflexi bacterium]|nr:primosomal protein N' [Chloroflexota bacterium]
MAPTAPEPPPSELRYAVVVVNTPISRRVTSVTAEETDAEEGSPYSRSFHYLIQTGMNVELGQLVWVPFQTRTLQGIVVALDDSAPVSNVRQILRVADQLPVLSPKLLELAGWISRTYLAPLQQVVAAMLPQGVLQGVDVVVRPLPLPENAELSSQQRQLYELLTKHQALTYARLQRLSPLGNWRAVIDQLVRRNWASRASESQPPAVRTKRMTLVRVAPDALQIKPGSAAQRRALQYLKPFGERWVRLDQALEESEVSRAVYRGMIERRVLETREEDVLRDPLQGMTFAPQQPPPLTSEQEAAWEAIRTDLDAPQNKPFALQGVTGSGKTEVYLRAAAHALEQGRDAIILVPEISLTPQNIRRFGARFGERLAVMHSQLTPGERYDQWRRIRASSGNVVIGARSALFAPVNRLGLVVLDEEHEWTYKQENTPRYHARDAAAELCRLWGATCLLGSATPSLESSYQAELGNYRALYLTQRLTPQHQPDARSPQVRVSELPAAQVVDMRRELAEGNTSIFSRALQSRLEQVLANQQQAILFLNRRGSASFVLCRDCGTVLECPRCELPLTYHNARSSLVCHHCGFRRANISECPSCGSKRIRYFGLGTERVEKALAERFPVARVIRWDQDTTTKRGQHDRILEQFTRAEADIMVGTQMVAKGLDLPRVTLVGVISADTMLHLPDLRASERTFQLLTQVAGRAGRSDLGGEVIIQTYNPDHPAVTTASRHDVPGFYAHEMAFRRAHWYPPLSRLVLMRYLNKNAQAAQLGAQAVAEQLRQRRARLGLAELDIIGPTPSFYAQIQGQYRWQLLLRGSDPASLLRDMFLPIGWQVDVDPYNML